MSCSLLDRVIVSTNDREIAEVSRQLGAAVPFMRPAGLAQDDTPMVAVIQHAIEALEEAGQKISTVVLLQPTSPLRAVADIEACAKPVLAGLAPAAMTVCEVEHNPYYSMGQVVNNRWVPLFPQHHATITCRQDAPVVYRETGAVFVVNRDTVMNCGTLFPPDTRPVVMPASRSIDIDSPTDLLFAEVLLR
jgi:CMP-N-acetylneuraminic acid synthetase